MTGDSEFPSQSTIPEPPLVNDPNYETYKRGPQVMIVDQRNSSEVSKVWQHGGERRRVDDGTKAGVSGLLSTAKRQIGSPALSSWRQSQKGSTPVTILLMKRVGSLAKRSSRPGKFFEFARVLLWMRKLESA